MKRPTKADTSAADFNALYEARFVDLAGHLYAFTGDNCETYDLVQEACIRAWQRWATVGRYEDPVAWVRRVAGNLAMSRHRRRQRSQSVLRGGNHVVPGLEPDRVALVQRCARCPSSTGGRSSCTTWPTCRSPRSPPRPGSGRHGQVMAAPRPRPACGGAPFEPARIRQIDWRNASIRGLGFCGESDDVVEFRNGSNGNDIPCVILPGQARPVYAEFLVEEPANRPATEDALVLVELGNLDAARQQALVPAGVSADGRTLIAWPVSRATGPARQATR